MRGVEIQAGLMGFRAARVGFHSGPCRAWAMRRDAQTGDLGFQQGAVRIRARVLNTWAPVGLTQAGNRFTRMPFQSSQVQRPYAQVGWVETQIDRLHFRAGIG